MRVYLVGAHSTGKTTLARYISQKYGLLLLTEVARLLLAEKELSLEAMRSDICSVNEYQLSVLRRQIHEEDGEDNFVSDRSFDNIGYAANHSTVLHEIMADPELAKYVEKLRKNDSVIFFVRPSKLIMVNDGVREQVDWDELVRIDAMTKFMLEMWSLRYFQISTPSMQERMRLIDSVLSLVGDPA